MAQSSGSLMNMNRISPFTVTIAALALTLSIACASASSQTSGFVPSSSDPEELFQAGDTLCFTADDGRLGRELWATSGELGDFWLVRDINPGADGIQVSHPWSMESIAFFKVTFPDGDAALWRTDGSTDGTFPIDLNLNDLAVQYDGPLAALGERMLFRAIEDSVATLWTTDGTQSGTRPICTRVDGARIPFVERLGAAVFGDAVLFAGEAVGEDGESRTVGLWRSDGTAEGTYQLRRFLLGPETFLATRDGAYFSAQEAASGRELWFSDGTADGTRLHHEDALGTDSGSPVLGALVPNNVLVYSAWTSETGRELHTISIQNGEMKTHDLTPGRSESDPYSFISSATFVFFAATNDSSGNEIWAYNPTRNSASLLKDINPGPPGSNPYALAPLGGGLVFSAKSAESGEELWYSDGTPDGTVMLSDIAPGKMDSSPYGSTYFKGRIYFAATQPLHGRELWRTSNTPNTVELVADVNDDASVNPSSHPEHLTPLGDLMVFVANDIAHGAELWRTDGSPSGTEMIRDIFPGRASSDPQELTRAESLIYFTADDGEHGPELWRTDGTSSGTALVMDIAQGVAGAGIRECTPFNGQLVFSAYREMDGQELWITTVDRAKRVMDIWPGAPSSNPSNLTVFQGRVYFRADDGVHGEELWRTDGTERGTELVKDIVPVPLGDAQLHGMVPGANGLLFSAAGDATGQELWRLAGETGTVSKVADIAQNR